MLPSSYFSLSIADSPRISGAAVGLQLTIQRSILLAYVGGMIHGKRAKRNAKHVPIRKCGINGKSKLIAILISLSFALIFVIRVPSSNENTSRSLTPPTTTSAAEAVPPVGMPQLAQPSLPGKENIARIPSHAVGPVKISANESGGVVAQYAHCSIVFNADNTAAHSTGILEPIVRPPAKQDAKKTILLGQIDEIMLFKTDAGLVALAKEGSTTILAERKATNAKLVYANDGMVVISYHGWNTKARTIEALGMVTGESLWISEHAAIDWPVAIQAPPAFLMPMGPRWESEFYRGLLLHDPTTGMEGSITALDPKTGAATATYPVGSAITSVATSGNKAYVGTENGDIYVFSGSRSPGCSQLGNNSNSLRVNAEPAGSIITICGKSAGASPKVIEGLLRGNYAITVSMGGRVPVTTDVNVAKDTVIDICIPAALKISREAPSGPYFPIKKEIALEHPVEKGNITISYDSLQNCLLAVNKHTRGILWQAVKVTNPIALNDTTIAYTISHPFGNDVIQYLVAHEIYPKSQLSERKSLHHWTSSSANIVMMKGETIYVADGTDLFAYNSLTSHLIWTAKETEDFESICGIVDGALVTAVAGDLVCRDTTTGSESLRFQNFYDNNRTVPTHAVINDTMYFESGKALVTVRE